MPYTPPPCMTNGVMCNDFTPGCRTSCQHYHNWERIHRDEKAQADSLKESECGYLDSRSKKVARALKRRKR